MQTPGPHTQVIPVQLYLGHRLYTRPGENIHVELQHDTRLDIFQVVL